MSLFALLLLASSAVHAQPALARAGDCGWVHGHYVVANGSRIHRIFVLGTGHALSLDFPDEGEGTVRDPFRHLYGRGRFTPFQDEIYGDFYVCARERHVSGHMQWVHLLRMKNLRIVHR
jgi:hypothetical protein